MVRTRSRPLPAGRIEPRAALVFGVVLAVLSKNRLGERPERAPRLLGAGGATLILAQPRERPVLERREGLVAKLRRHGRAGAARCGRLVCSRGSRPPESRFVGVELEVVVTAGRDPADLRRVVGERNPHPATERELSRIEDAGGTQPPRVELSERRSVGDGRLGGRSLGGVACHPVASHGPNRVPVTVCSSDRTHPSARFYPAIRVSGEEEAMAAMR